MRSDILLAAKELGNRGADIYKAEIPLGDGAEAGVWRRCAQLARVIDDTWVLLSSGVPQELFPSTVE